MHVIVCICEREFRDEINIRGEKCKTRVNLSFSKKKGKHGELATTIQVESLEVFYILDDETGLIVGFVTRNLVA